jgi:subtilisin family serine protease
MAAPVVSGLAALLMSHYPALTATQVKDIILQSATIYSGEETLMPGTESIRVPFTSLSATGGVINAYAAVLLAEEMIP